MLPFQVVLWRFLCNLKDLFVVLFTTLFDSQLHQWYWNQAKINRFLGFKRENKPLASASQWWCKWTLFLEITERLCNPCKCGLYSDSHLQLAFLLCPAFTGLQNKMLPLRLVFSKCRIITISWAFLYCLSLQKFDTDNRQADDATGDVTGNMWSWLTRKENRWTAFLQMWIPCNLSSWVVHISDTKNLFCGWACN